MNPIIVVEGTTDFTKIKQVGYKYCVKTCGFCVSRETINFLKSCSINRNIILLLETDAPYLAPTPYRGQRNEPSYLEEVIKKFSQIKNIEENELSEMLINNTKRVFKI